MRCESYDKANTLGRMERFYSCKYGLLKFLHTSKFESLVVSKDEYNFMIGNVVPKFTSQAQAYDESGIEHGYAVGLNKEKSRVRALGEYIERYSSSYNEGEFIDNVMYDSFENMSARGMECMDFNHSIHFEEHQYEESNFPYAQYSHHHPISWLEGEDIVYGKRLWIPLQRILLKYPVPKVELPYVPAISTGLACGTSFTQAALNAIYEVIERDSFMITWLLKVPARQINLDIVHNKELRELYQHIRKHMVGEDMLTIYDISKTNGVHTILTIIRNDLPHAFGVIVSLASHANPEIAITKALEEVCQIQSLAYSYLFSDEKYENLEKEDVDSLYKHLFYYCTSTQNSNVDFLTSSSDSIRLSEMPDYSGRTGEEELNRIQRLFHDSEQSIYIVEVTKPEVREQGFLVVKAIIPGYVDLDINHRIRQLNNLRLKKFQKQYGAMFHDEPPPFA